MSLIPHQLRVWYERALTSVSGSAYFWNLVFRGITDISCPFQWFEFGENQTSTAHDMIKKSDGAVMLSPHHDGAVGHIRLRAHKLLHSVQCKVLNGNAPHVFDTTSTSGLV